MTIDGGYCEVCDCDPCDCFDYRDYEVMCGPKHNHNRRGAESTDRKSDPTTHVPSRDGQRPSHRGGYSVGVYWAFASRRRTRGQTQIHTWSPNTHHTIGRRDGIGQHEKGPITTSNSSPRDHGWRYL